MGTAAKQEVTGTTQAIYSANYGAELIVCQCGWSREAEQEFGIDAIIAGDVAVDRYWIATADGKGANLNAWASGAEAEDNGAVYFEKWTADGRGSHGWLDAETRKIVQTG